MKKYLLTLFICLVAIIDGKAQDFVYSQFYNNPLYLNPAFAGSDPYLKVYSAYRNQWANVPGQFRAMHLAADLDVGLTKGKSGKSGLGFGMIINNNIQGEGLLTTTQYGGIVNVILPVAKAGKNGKGKTYIYGGLQITGVSNTINYDKLVFSDQIDPVRGIVRSSDVSSLNGARGNYVNLDMGFMMRSYLPVKRLNHVAYGVGIVGRHLNEPNQSITGSDTRLQPRFTIHGSMFWPVDRNNEKNTLVISPAFVGDWQIQRTLNFGISASKSLNSGKVFFKNNLHTGGAYFTPYVAVWLRSRITQADALIFNPGFVTYIPGAALKIELGYSYDATISRLSSATSGSNEITLKITSGLAFKRKSIKCSDFKSDIQLRNPTYF